MARTVKSKTLKVQSGVNAGGLTPGKIAEVEDTAQVRGLIAAGLWTLLVTEAELQVVVGPEETIAVDDFTPEG